MTSDMKKYLLEPRGESPSEIANIADEFGSILGLVTQNDVLESIDA